MILPALLLASSFTVAVADRVPRLNIEASCRADSRAAGNVSPDIDACMKSENAARDQLAKNWNSFAARDRASCLALTTTGTAGTYTELLTCVEMKRDARQLPKEPSTIGRGL
jgi:hypothetical protein